MRIIMCSSMMLLTFIVLFYIHKVFFYSAIVLLTKMLISEICSMFVEV